MDLTQYLRFVLAFVFVLALIGLLSWVIRRFKSGGKFLSGGGTRRLGVIESAAIDGKHRLVLVRRDDTEHLLLLGANSDLVVESDIRDGQSSRQPAPLVPVEDAS